jgi:hypothetical protein
MPTHCGADADLKHAKLLCCGSSRRERLQHLPEGVGGALDGVAGRPPPLDCSARCRFLTASSTSIAARRTCEQSTRLSTHDPPPPRRARAL